MRLIRAGCNLPFCPRMHWNRGIRGGILCAMDELHRICSEASTSRSTCQGAESANQRESCSAPSASNIQSSELEILQPPRPHTLLLLLAYQQHRKDGPLQPPTGLQCDLSRCRDALIGAMPPRQQEHASPHGALPVEDSPGRDKHHQHWQDLVSWIPPIQSIGYVQL